MNLPLGNIRSLMTEKIFSQIQVKCVYDQCSKLFLIQNVQKHEEKCEFRVTKCPICQEKIAMNSLQGHLSENHATLISKQSTQFGYRIAVPRVPNEDIEATMIVDTGMYYFFQNSHFFSIRSFSRFTFFS